MAELNHYTSRTPGAASAAGVGGGPSENSCTECERRGASSGDDERYDYQRIPLFEPIPATDPASREGRDFVITVDHRGDLFHPKAMFLEARNADGSVNYFAYVRAYEIDEDRQDCVSSSDPRGIPVHVYSMQGGCCDGLKVALRPFENKKERRTLKIHVRVFGAKAGVLQGYLRGRCVDCGYEKHCRGDRTTPPPG